MDYTKELLLASATIFVSTGATLLKTDTVMGTIIILIGCGVFVGRGFYKKYF